MRKLLNILYVITENSYLSLDGENIVVSKDGNETIRYPFTNLEGIVCFNYMGCSPALMAKCVENNKSLCFLSPFGKFLCRVTGPTKGNVFLRKNQLELLQNKDIQVQMVQNLIAAKLKNTKNLLLRSRRDNGDQDNCKTHCVDIINNNLQTIKENTDLEILRGIEGQTAKAYFDIFNNLIIQQKESFYFFRREKRPPKDRVNALLSFMYTLCTNDIESALETVGLDPFIGFFHTLRPGRASLACDLMEEFRAFVERFVISLINLKIVQEEDLVIQSSGAVLLTKDGKNKVLNAWQTKKREVKEHPIIKEKIKIGLFPYVQACLLAKYIRGEINEYKNLMVEI